LIADAETTIHRWKPFSSLAVPDLSAIEGLYLYDPKDDQRAHIMGFAVAPNGSVMWHVIDLKTENDRWVERR
jgi:hypothetical protein